MASHFPKGARTTTAKARDMSTTEIIWQGKAISGMKSFRKLSCRLCMKEQIELLKLRKENPEHNMINSNWEIYRACRHRTSFHRYTESSVCEICTDDRVNPERVQVQENGEVSINDYISRTNVTNVSDLSRMLEVLYV